MHTATPTLTELATIAHTRRCSVVATHHRRELLDDTASPLRFSAFASGRPSKQWRPASAMTTTDRIESDVQRLTALDPARRMLGLATRPC
ncbi:MAG TPA: hypothetical protein DCE75_06950 [Acidimicrobiaceae bacterium]|nr:hypothetical protein [Acidimicrobiaceae bacterium]